MVSNAFVESVETQAAIAPQAIAFEADSCCMTYGELSSASNAIAAKLREMTSDRFPVVVFGHKDFRMVASFLGCLKSGHAFVPVDVELPASRIGDILSQLDSPFVVCAAPLSGRWLPMSPPIACSIYPAFLTPPRLSTRFLAAAPLRAIHG